jgi:NAD(P)-dependent dehydrogenase (short-subunit alcohol dehydrogenase family)
MQVIIYDPIQNKQAKMARILITGSADGLGQMAAVLLIKQGHQVVLHARNKQRGEQAMEKTPGAENVLVADLSSMEETKNLAEQANQTKENRYAAVADEVEVQEKFIDVCEQMSGVGFP